LKLADTGVLYTHKYIGVKFGDPVTSRSEALVLSGNLDNKKYSILSIDDEPANQRLVSAALNPNFDVLLACSGEEGLRIIEKKNPDLVMLDVNLPEKDGYQIGKKIREIYSDNELPIIFVSAQTELESRLKGYEHGGCDYICKPVDIRELALKLNLLMARKEQFHQVKESLGSTQKAMFSAMGYGGELGTVIRFFEESFNCVDFKSLGDVVFSTCNEFDLSVSVQFRSPFGVGSYSSSGSVSPLEQQLLDSALYAERIISTRNTSMYNGRTASILVKNMPIEDDELCGRIRDHLALILKGCEAQCASIINTQKAKTQRNSAVENVLNVVFGDLAELERLFDHYSVDVETSYEDFHIDFEETISTAEIRSEHSVVLMESLDKLLGGVGALSKNKASISAAIVRISSAIEELRE